MNAYVIRAVSVRPSVRLYSKDPGSSWTNFYEG